MSDHKVVLIKPKKSNQEYYISTFNRAGLPFDYQCIVENDEIIRINMTPYYCFMSHITDDDKFKEIISSSNYSMKQYSKRKNKTYDVALKLSKGFDLKEPIKLYKQVKGLRAASDKELEQIEYKIVEYLSNYKKFYFKEIVYHSKEYSDLYSLCFENDLLSAFFKYSEPINELGII